MEDEDDEEFLYQEEEAYELEEGLADEEEYEDEEYEDEYEDEAPYEYPEEDDDSRSKEEESGHSAGIHPFFFIPNAATSSAGNHCSEKGIYAQKTEEKPQPQMTGKSILGVILLLLSALIIYVACGA